MLRVLTLAGLAGGTLAACSVQPVAAPETPSSPPAGFRPSPPGPAAGVWLAAVATPRGAGASVATGITGAGLLVGTATGSRTPAMAWTAWVDAASRSVTKPAALAPLSPGGAASTAGVSGDLIVGTSTDYKGREQAVYWRYPDPTAHLIPLAGLAKGDPIASGATAAGGDIAVGWFVDAAGVDHAFFYEAGSYTAAEITLPYPGRAYGISDDGRVWSGCYRTPTETVAFVRGAISYDLPDPPYLANYDRQSCAYDVDGGGVMAGFIMYNLRSDWYRVAAIGDQVAGWSLLFPPSPQGGQGARNPSSALGIGFGSVGWFEVQALDGLPSGRYPTFNRELLPALSSNSEARAISSDGNCLIAGKSGWQAVVWGC